MPDRVPYLRIPYIQVIPLHTVTRPTPNHRPAFKRTRLVSAPTPFHSYRQPLHSLIELNCRYTSAPNLNRIPLPNMTKTLAIPFNSSNWPIRPASPYGLSFSVFDIWCRHFIVVIITSSSELIDSLFNSDWNAVVERWRDDGSGSSGRMPVDLNVCSQFPFFDAGSVVTSKPTPSTLSTPRAPRKQVQTTDVREEKPTCSADSGRP